MKYISEKIRQKVLGIKNNDLIPQIYQVDGSHIHICHSSDILKVNMLGEYAFTRVINQSNYYPLLLVSDRFEKLPKDVRDYIFEVSEILYSLDADTCFASVDQLPYKQYETLYTTKEVIEIINVNLKIMSEIDNKLISDEKFTKENIEKIKKFHRYKGITIGRYYNMEYSIIK